MKNDLLSELPEEKVNLIDKYRLEPHLLKGRLYWVRDFRNRPLHPYITHRGMKKCSTLDLVFSFYGLCVAKMNYFSKNIEDYLPCKLNYVTGEMEGCATWDMEFLVQRATAIRIDLRNLAGIKDIETFKEMCRWLERKLKERRELQESYSSRPLHTSILRPAGSVQQLALKLMTGTSRDATMECIGGNP